MYEWKHEKKSLKDIIVTWYKDLSWSTYYNTNDNKIWKNADIKDMN